jgi:hypothetical protein
LEKSGAKATINGNNSAGSVGIWKTSLGGKFFPSLRGLPLPFQRPGMDKVQLSSTLSIFAKSKMVNFGHFRGIYRVKRCRYLRG